MNDLLINPYGERGMVREPQKFFGRARELREVYGRLATMQSVSVIGARRIGKSSFLYRIAHPQNGELPAPFEVHYLDLQRVFSVAEFYERACISLGREEGQSHRDLEAAIQDKRIVLCLDEFEQAYTKDFGDEFFNALRSYAQEGHLALVVATQTPLNELHALYLQDQDVTSKFHNIFTRLPLGELSPAEARELVAAPRNGQRFSEDEINGILKLAGQHPYWLNYVCAEAYAAKQTDGLNFAEIEKKLKEERGLSQTARPAVPHSEAADAPSIQSGGAVSPVKDPDAPVRLAIVLGLVAMAIGSFSANIGFAPGMYLALTLLAVGLFLLLKSFAWRGGTQ